MDDISFFLVTGITILISFALVIVILFAQGIAMKGRKAFIEHKKWRSAALFCTSLCLTIASCAIGMATVWRLPEIFPL